MDIQEYKTVEWYGLISFLLEYPTEEVYDSLSEIKKEIKDQVPSSVIKEIIRFIDRRKKATLENWQDEYIEYFDFGRSTNLYVTYSKLGEQRQRGIELLKLKEFYQENNYEITEKELPDYLPLMLEFSANTSVAVSNELFQKYVHEIQAIRNNLKEKGSVFTLLFDALIELMKQNGVRTEEEKKEEKVTLSDIERSMMP